MPTECLIVRRYFLIRSEYFPVIPLQKLFFKRQAIEASSAFVVGRTVTVFLGLKKVRIPLKFVSLIFLQILIHLRVFLRKQSLSSEATAPLGIFFSGSTNRRL